MSLKFKPCQANDSSFGSAITRMYNNQLNSPGVMGSVARFDRGFGAALREGMSSVASSFLHPLDTLSSSLLFATDIADIPLELLGTMFSSDAKTRNLQRLDGIRDVGVGLISGDATQSGHAAGQLSSLVFSAYGVKMGGALERAVLREIKFDIAPRVEKQLIDSRMGSLAGKIDMDFLGKLLKSKKAQFLYDNGTGHVNIINQVNGKLIRITVLRNEFKIISVGPIKARNVAHSIEKGRFTPIGEQRFEAVNLEEYMKRVQP